MATMNDDVVLITGAGGPAGIGVIRSLGGRVTTVAVDAGAMATGLRLADHSAVVPAATSPDFVDALCAVAERTGATLLCSTVAEEMAALHAGADRLDRAGLRRMLPTADSVESCIDKWKFAQVMAAAGVPHPTTCLGAPDGVAPPWILKPRFGRGSRDVFVVAEPCEAAVLARRVEDPIFQHAVSGREFTVDALVTPSGFAGGVARWRLETKAGISTKGETFDDPALLELCASVLDAVGLVGPANVQGFVADDGDVSIIEVNPRFSGGLALSLHSGADLVGAYLAAIRGEDVAAGSLRGRPGVVMLRHFEEVFA